MKKVHVVIKGISPLLQHRFPIEEQGVNKSRKVKKIYDPEVEAKKSLYLDAEGHIYQPSEHIYQALVKSGSGFIFEGRQRYGSVLKAGVTIEPENIPLKSPKPYTIDSRPVVIQKSRVLCWRPRFEEWELEFDILILDDKNINISVLKEILDTAGLSGLGDYRPRFGRFQVIEWKEL